mmetsp:Transcript_33707/g.49979  ORF Transcript_33707/g.49979 Transcript_33707/m.49979 type:complete len:216 (-) Transcript_33707:114-761(-)
MSSQHPISKQVSGLFGFLGFFFLSALSPFDALSRRSLSLTASTAASSRATAYDSFRSIIDFTIGSIFANKFWHAWSNRVSSSSHSPGSPSNENCVADSLCLDKTKKCGRNVVSASSLLKCRSICFFDNQSNTDFTCGVASLSTALGPGGRIATSTAGFDENFTIQPSLICSTCVLVFPSSSRSIPSCWTLSFLSSRSSWVLYDLDLATALCADWI